MPASSALLAALEKKTGLSRRQVNRLIGQEASDKTLPRDLAALSLANSRGIAIHRFATKAQLAELRGAPIVSNHTVVAAPIQTRSGRGQRVLPTAPTRNNSMFVVHGRDSRLTADMYAFLRAIGINPMEWNDAIKAAKGGANPIVGDVINQAMKKVQGVMVLFSPDEDARLRRAFVSERDKKKGLQTLERQPRPNVIFEAGLALGAHSNKTILVQVGDIREISDIAGKHMVNLNNSVSSRKSLANRLKDKLKFKINLTGDAWLTVGDFDR